MTGLAGKAIVVTGAGTGLGRAYAVALAGAGARVVVNDVDATALRAVAEEIRATGGLVSEHAGSVADWDDAAGLVSACRDTAGRIDGLVGNAAVHHSAGPLEETEDRLRRIVEVNVLGSLFPALHAFRAMAEQGGGRILTVTSGAHVGLRGLTAYGSTKGAVASLTYNLALEGEAHGIRVNALAPVAQTGMSPVADREDGVTRPAPSQIAPIVLYLMSEAAGHVTGQVVRYDGRSVSLLDPPHFRTRRVSEDIDTPEGLARAFAGPLAGDLAPVGLY